MARPEDATAALEACLRYLETLSLIQIDPRVRARVGFSDVVQETMLEAYKDLDRIAGMSEPDRRRWLARMLVNNLKDQVDHHRAGCRDVGRDRPVDGELDASSGRLEGWLAADSAPPDDRAADNERAGRVLEAIAQLPDREREALVLQRYHGWKLREIAAHLGCTTGTVAGLHARALAGLRKLLPDLMGE